MRSPANWSAFALLGALCLAPLSTPLFGCSHSRGGQVLADDHSPVELRYEWGTGSRFTGSVQRQSIAHADGERTEARAVSFDVHLTVLGRDTATGGLRVSAKMSSLEITWPEAMGEGAAARSLVDEITEHLEGVTLRFSVGDDGDILELPELPTNLEGNTLLVLRAMIEGLKSGFVALPQRAIKPSEAWSHVSKAKESAVAGENTLRSRETTGTFLSWLAPDGQQPRRAQLKLDIDEQRDYVEATRGGFDRRRSRVEAIFDPVAHWVTQVTGTETLYDTRSDESVRFAISWRRQASTDEDAPGLERQIQRGINDPCDPEYVGVLECKENTPTGAKAPAAKPASVPKPGVVPGGEAEADPGAESSANEATPAEQAEPPNEKSETPE